MRPSFIFLIGIFLLTIYACHFCNRVDCSEVGGTISLAIMHNGQNAVFGANPILPKDSIQLRASVSPGEGLSVGFNDSLQTVNVFIKADQEFYIEIKNFGVDTIYGTTKVVGSGDCCPIWDWEEIKVNGETICTQGCNEVIVLEI